MASGGPETIPSDLPPVVILGASQTGVLGLRGLQRRGVQTWCVDCQSDAPAFRSVYGPARLCPDPDLDLRAWVAFMVGLSAEIGRRAVLIPSSDLFVVAIAAGAKALTTHFVLPHGVELQAALADKKSQYELAARHRMPMPLTRLARTQADVSAFAEEATFPCVLKPTHFRVWRRLGRGNPLANRKVVTATGPEQLLTWHALASEVSSEVILQEMISGDDTDKCVYLSCYDAGGARMGSVVLRELRCDPVGLGPATVTEPVLDPEVDGICDRFLRSIGYRGICEIEVKRDRRDGRPKLIEANPRLSGSGDAAPYAGLETCWLHYLDLIGKPVPPVTPGLREFRHIVLRNDARVLLDYWWLGLISWRDIVHSYTPPLAFYDFDVRDWRLSLETVVFAARSLAMSPFRVARRRP